MQLIKTLVDEKRFPVLLLAKVAISKVWRSKANGKFFQLIICYFFCSFQSVHQLFSTFSYFLFYQIINAFC